MYIYCSSIWLQSNTQFEEIFSVISYWLNKKTHNNIYLDFIHQPSRTFSDGSRLDLIKIDDEFPRLYSFLYTEQDEDVSGRRWITEIGICQEKPDSDIQCSFFLQTNEISINVPPPNITTRPWLIWEIMKRCKPSFRTPGTEIKTLENDDIDAFAYEVDYDERRYPIILVSPTTDGNYLVDLDSLLYQTSGLAQIVKIPTGMDTYKVSNVLGKNNSAYNGAVNILFPSYKKTEKPQIPTFLILANDFDEWKTAGASPVSEILRVISHRMNVPNRRIHISPDFVKDEMRKRELAKTRQKSIASGNLQQQIDALEQEKQEKDLEIEKYKEKIQELQDENYYYLNEYETVNNEIKEKQRKIINLEAQNISLLNSRKQRNSLDECSEEVRLLLETYFSDGLTPAQSLDLIAKLYPDRIEVLDNAYRSAEESSRFFDKKVVFDLLRRLATNYWQSLVDGKGDVEARLTFGKDEYSSSESESGEKNRKTRQRRTFVYNGVEIEMMKHLKVGTKDSKVDTIRIHFEWLSDEKKIIIGHCGPHLDFG